MPSYVSGQTRDVLPDGTYDFVVKFAILKTSKNGNEMIEIQLEVKDVLIFDYLVFEPKSAFKIDQFRRAIGETVLPGEVCEINPSDLEGKSGKCTVITDFYLGRARNKVGSYLEMEVADELPL